MVIHVQRNVLSVGVEADATPHAVAQLHVKSLASRRTQVGASANARTRINAASGISRLESDVKDIASAFGVQNSPSVPVRKNMKMSAEEESPRANDSRHDNRHETAKGDKEKELWNASQTRLGASDV